MGNVESHEKQFARLFDMNNDGKLDKEELRRARLAWKLARKEFGALGAVSAAYALDDYADDEYAYDDMGGDYYYAGDDEYHGQYYGEYYDESDDDEMNVNANAMQSFDDEDDEYDDDYSYFDEDELNALKRLLRRRNGFNN